MDVAARASCFRLSLRASRSAFGRKNSAISDSDLSRVSGTKPRMNRKPTKLKFKAFK